MFIDGKYKVILLIILWFISYSVSAQNVIEGIVVDEQQQALSNATITVRKGFDSAIVAFGFTRENGRFSIRYKNYGSDTLMLTVSLLGYFNKEITFLSATATPFNVLLQQTKSLLPEVVVRTSGIYSRGDTVNYNVKAFAQKQDLVIGDIIRKLPGIEISESGTIKYQGRAINKFYIEGLELLDDKYGLATNNIPANAVDQVQILENHQPIKALDSFSHSSRAALNLKLSASAKNKIIGRAKVGVGIAPLLLDNEIVPMKFDKKNQTILSYKYNNAGYNYSAELDLLNQSDYYNSIKGNTLKNDVIFIPMASLPNVNRNRYLFNNLHTISVNHLDKLSQDYTLKFNVDYINDLRQQETGTRTRYFYTQDTIVINEQQFLSRKQELLRGSVSLVSNTKERYFKNVTSINLIRDKDYGNIFSDDTTNQKITHTATGFINDLQLVKVKNTAAISFSSFVSYSNQPQTLVVQPGKYAFLLNDNKEYNSLQQNIYLTTFFTNNAYSFSKRYRRFSIENKLGVSYLQQSFQSLLQKNYLSQVLPVNDSFSNNLNGSEMMFYNNLNVNATFKKWKISAGFPMSVVQLAKNDAGKDNKKRENKFLPNFFINSSYQFNSDVTLLVKAGHETYYSSPYTATDKFILSNYRTFRNQSGIFKSWANKNAEINLNYKNIVKSFFSNYGFSISNDDYNVIGNQHFVNTLLFSNAIRMQNTASNFRLHGNISKYIYKLKTSFAATVFAGQTRNKQLQNSTFSNFANKYVGFNTNVNTKIKEVIVEYKSQYQQFHSGFLNLDKTSKTILINQNLALITSLPANFLLKLNMEQSGFKQNSTINRNYYFADFSVRKKLEKNKVDVELLWQNIFNTNSFETFNVYSNVESRSYYRIRPAQVLLKINFLL